MELLIVVVLLAGVVVVPYIGLNLAWNLLLLACRGLAPIVRFGQDQEIKWLSPDHYWVGLLSGVLVGAMAIPNLMGPSDGKAKNSSIQANVHHVQLCIERYALDHDGRYPESGQVPGDGVISLAMLSRAPDQATRAADGKAVTASASATPPPSSTSNFSKAIASTLR